MDLLPITHYTKKKFLRSPISIPVYTTDSIKNLINNEEKYIIFPHVLYLNCIIKQELLLKVRTTNNFSSDKEQRMNNYKALFNYLIFEGKIGNFTSILNIEIELFEKIIEKFLLENDNLYSKLFIEPITQSDSILIFKDVRIYYPFLYIKDGKVILLDFNNNIYTEVWDSIDPELKKHPKTGLKKSDFYDDWLHSDGRRPGF